MPRVRTSGFSGARKHQATSRPQAYLQPVAQKIRDLNQHISKLTFSTSPYASPTNQGPKTANTMTTPQRLETVRRLQTAMATAYTTLGAW